MVTGPAITGSAPFGPIIAMLAFPHRIPALLVRLAIGTGCGLVAVVGGGAPSTQAAVIRYPPYCGLIRSLALDRVNDTVAIPDAYDAVMGEVAADRLAKFRVYGLGESRPFDFDVTSDTKLISIRARLPQGGDEPAGRFTYSTSGGQSAYYYYSPRWFGEDRLVFIDFEYRCHPRNYQRGDLHRFTARYLLTVRPSLVTPASIVHLDEASDTAMPSPMPSQRLLAPLGTHPAAGCADLEVTMVSPAGPVEQGELIDYEIRLRNLGPNLAVRPVVEFSSRPWPLILDHVVPAQGSFGYHSPQTWTWGPGDLASGASTSATVTCYAAAPGTAKFRAHRYLGEGDCNPDNDRADATLAILPALRPDLTGSWSDFSVEQSGAFLWPKHTVRGRLRVSNNGDADAGPTRMAVLLSNDRSPGPEDRLLGWAEIPALAAGASTEQALKYSFHSTPWQGERRGLALLDSSNTELEHQEGNNFVASRPAP
jgi:hypothetical protein